MAKGRFVSRSISANEQLASVSLLADFLFGRCIAHLDAEGRMTGNPQLIKSTVVPLRSEIREDAIPGLLGELASAVDHEGRPLVVWYEVAGRQVLYFPGFDRAQSGLRKDREAPSRLPSPTDPSARRLGVDPSATPPFPPPAPLPTDSGPTPELVPPKRREEEVKGSEAKRAHAREAAAAPPAAALPKGARELLDRCYEGATPERLEEVTAQLRATLNGGAKIRKGEIATARDAAHLDRVCRETVAEWQAKRLRDPDKAIVVALKKLRDNTDARGHTPSEAAAAERKEDDRRAARERQRRQQAVTRWAAAHPTDFKLIEAAAEKRFAASAGVPFNRHDPGHRNAVTAEIETLVLERAEPAGPAT